ncbi:MAG TPA: UDP-2,3-diacylglucosamine diphosphatase [Verrucomicrobiae bacterium]|nr:UDP-2,3-diacylglucosamine diphosphatase [Verrucomicrobiae bacterium]
MEYRTVWMSDLHLGTRGSNAASVLDFLKHNEFERLYLVGDVIDIWRLRRERYWPQTHNDVIQKILRKARKGTQIIVIPGNHDEFCLNFLGVYGNIVVKERDVYTTAEGERLLVMHGHEFDSVTVHAKWMAHLGDAGYTILLRLNRPLNLMRRVFGLGFWSLSAYVKQNVKKVVSSISRFEEAVARYAEMHNVGGIVCGHIHTPAVRQIRGVNYYNTGDWVESSTALVEHLDGRLELVYWREQGADEVTALNGTPSDLADKSALLAATR